MAEGLGQNMSLGATKVDVWGKTVRDVYFQNDLVRAGGASGLWDPEVRARELDRDGTAGEMIYTAPGDDKTGAVGVPFSNSRRGIVYSYEHRFAGARANNRWVADLCSYQPERHAGIIVCPTEEITPAVEEITRARKSGMFGGFSFPQPRVLVNNPEAFWCHPRNEPIWDALEELDIPVQSHQSIGGISYGEYPGTRWIASIEGHFVARRQIWQLIFSGALERHPNLRLCFAEAGGADIAYWINAFDYFYTGKRGRDLRKILPRKPSEYWYRQCFVGASPHSGRLEVAMRHRIGVGNMLWGSDYPHKEGTWPFTDQRMKAMFAGVPQEEARQILGENAARICPFDMKKLRAVADRIGPKVSDFEDATPAAGAEWGKLWTQPEEAEARKKKMRNAAGRGLLR